MRAAIRRLALPVVLTAALAVAAGFARADALVPLPDRDPFYAVPAGIGGLPNGTILRTRAIAASAGGLPLAVHAWQLEYKSLDAHGRATAMVTTVMVPTAPWKGRGPRPLVSYQVAEDGADSKCAASYALHAGLASALTLSNAAAETSFIADVLNRGWAVVASDYEGPDSAFLAAPEEAHGVLDGIRAALRFTPAAFAARTPVGLIGYSGGGYATSVAALYQRGYAPHLHIAGAAIGSPTADIAAEITAFSGSFAGGAIAMGIAALDRAYPEAHLTRYLNAAGRRAVAASARDCLAQSAARFPFARVEQWEAAPGVLELPAVTAFLHSISPEFMPGHPSIPILLYQDANDELAPAPPALATMHEWCARGATVDIHLQPGGEHLEYEGQGLPVGLDYLDGRFAGTPPPSSCPPVQHHAHRKRHRHRAHARGRRIRRHHP